MHVLDGPEYDIKLANYFGKMILKSDGTSDC